MQNTDMNKDKRTLVDLVKETYKILTDKDLRRIRELERESRSLEKEAARLKEKIDEYRYLKSPYIPPPESNYYRDQLSNLNRIQSNPQSNSLSAEIQRRAVLDAINNQRADDREARLDWEEQQAFLQGRIDKYSQKLKAINERLSEVNGELVELVDHIASNNGKSLGLSHDLDGRDSIDGQDEIMR